MIPRFQNRLALWALRLAIIIPAVVLLGLLFFEFSGCTAPSPDDGEIKLGPICKLAFTMGWVGVSIAMFVSPVVIVLSLIGEVWARHH